MKSIIILLLLICRTCYSLDVYFIPGLGVDSRVYTKLTIDSSHTCHYLEWPKCSEFETMSSYADKFIQCIDTSESFAVVGLSLGGMVAVEIAHKCETAQCIQISSAKTKNDVPYFYDYLRYLPAHNMINDPLFHTLSKINSYLIAPFYKDAKIYSYMLMDYSSKMFTNQVNMLLRWQRTQCDVDVMSIHGGMDPILPLKHHTSVEYIIPKASHKLVITHAEKTSAWINAILDSAN